MPEIRIGMVGYQFMGRAHSNAFRQVGPFMGPKLVPRLKAICGRNAPAVERFARQFGWEDVETDYRRLVEREDIDLIDIGSPGDTHAPIAIAAAQAGKHVLCEKPLANTLAEARAMWEAVKKARVHHMVAFNYRRVPAVALARDLIQKGRLGRIYHFRGVYLQSWLLDPKLPRFWRMDRKVAGSGALGDLGAHVIDLARHLVGEISEVCADLETFTRERPLPENPKKMGKVTVDDMASALLRFENGARGTLEVTRFATGRENANRFEINGEKGALWFDLEDMNRLHFFDNATPEARTRGFADVLVTSGAHHPYWKHWWPGGHIIGWEHSFTHEVYDFLEGIARGRNAQPDFRDGARTQAVLESIAASAENRRWAKVPHVA